MPSEKQLANLRPIKQGERRAAKPAKDHRSRRLVIKLTEAEFSLFSSRLKLEGEKTLTSLARKLLGF